jgi:transposase
MDVLYTNCAGLDVHKKNVKVCLFKHVPNGQPQKELRTYLTTTEELLKLSDWRKPARMHACGLRGNGSVLETGV